MIQVLSALANGAIASIVLTGTVWLVMRLALRQRLNASTRYALWAATLAATLLLPICYVGAPHTATPGPNVAAPIVSMEALPEAPYRITPSAARVSTIRRPAVVSLGSSASRLPQWFAAGWAVVSFFLLIRLSLSWVLLDRRRARAVPPPMALANQAHEWLAECRAQRPKVALVVSDEISIPIAVGPRHPSILIPASLVNELAHEDLARIVVHEAAHLARWDDYGLLAQRLIEALFPWHPVVRWITRQMDLEREVACDDFVVEATGQARQYASCLTRMVELCGGRNTSLTAVAAANSRSQLARRVDRLLDKGRHTGTELLKARLIAMVALMAAVAWMIGRSPQVVAFAMPASRAPEAAAPQILRIPPVQALAPQAPANNAIAMASLAEPPAPRAYRPDATEQAPPAPQRAAAVTIQPSQIFVPVQVTDPMGRFVTGLTAANFKVFEGGVEQQIAQFVSDDSPVSMGIVVDVSGSMTNNLDSERQAVAELLKNARPADEFFLVQFNHDVVLSVPFTNVASAIQNSLDSARAGGGTAMRDAVHMAVNELTHAHNSRKALVVLSKGTDNSSGRSLSDMRGDLSATDASVYSINFAADPAARGVAEALGQGTTIPAGSVDEARNAGAKIAMGLRNRYVLAFTPINQDRDGAYHRLQVELVPPHGLPPLNVRYRSGYYGAK